MADSIPQERKQAGGFWDNRRAFIRYRCAPATPGKIELGEDLEFQTAWVLDLSEGGIGLQMQRPLETAFITIHLKGKQRSYKVTAQVAHSSRNNTGDWIIGCEFVSPLQQDDLDDLLG